MFVSWKTEDGKYTGKKIYKEEHIDWFLDFGLIKNFFF